MKVEGEYIVLDELIPTNRLLYPLQFLYISSPLKYNWTYGSHGTPRQVRGHDFGDGGLLSHAQDLGGHRESSRRL